MELKQLCKELESATRKRLCNINSSIRRLRKCKYDTIDLVVLKSERRITDQLLSNVKSLMNSNEITEEQYYDLKRKYLDSSIS